MSLLSVVFFATGYFLFVFKMGPYGPLQENQENHKKILRWTKCKCKKFKSQFECGPNKKNFRVLSLQKLCIPFPWAILPGRTICEWVIAILNYLTFSFALHCRNKECSFLLFTVLERTGWCVKTTKKHTGRRSKIRKSGRYFKWRAVEGSLAVSVQKVIN